MELYRYCACIGFLFVLVSLGFLLSGRECLCVINVEAHATHWRMAKQDSVRIVTASMYQSARCAFGMLKKKKMGET